MLRTPPTFEPLVDYSEASLPTLRQMFWSQKFNPSTDLEDLSGKVIIVTGGNKGIGYATVKHLARRGAKVYLGARTEEKGAGAIAKLKEEGIGSRDVVWLFCDLSTPALVKQSGESFLSKEEGLDVLSTSEKALKRSKVTRITFVYRLQVHGSSKAAIDISKQTPQSLLVCVVDSHTNNSVMIVGITAVLGVHQGKADGVLPTNGEVIGAVVWIARHESLLSRLQVRSVNSNIVVVIEWTDAKDSGVLIKARWLDLRNVETAVVTGGKPKGLRILDEVIGVEDISIVTLNPFCSALSENNADGFRGKGDDNNFRVSRATMWGEVNSA